MTKKFPLLLLAFASAGLPAAHAAPMATNGKKEYRRQLIGNSAEEVWNILPVFLNEEFLNGQKTFQTKGEELKIRCVKSEDGSQCEIFLAGEESEDLAVNMFNGPTAQDLYASLQGTVYSSRTSDLKVFSDSEGQFSIYCSKSLIPNGDPYACRVDISLD
jgi:hypothetical protein